MITKERNQTRKRQRVAPAKLNLADFSLQLAEMAEDLVEAHAVLSPSFVLGLKQSVRDATKGKTKKIESLLDLR